jgi:thiol-disulfide isomerase/thioredoxin
VSNSFEPQVPEPVEAREAEGPRVITIRPVHLAIVALSVVAFAGGVWLAQTQAEPAAPVQSASVQPQFAPVEGGQQPLVIQQQPLGEMYEGEVMPLDNSHPMLGQPYIDIAGTDLNGNPAKISDFAGKPVMLNFWATWCPPCRVEMPWMEEVYNEFKDQGFVIIAVDAGERVPDSAVKDTVTAYIQGTGLTFPVLLPDDPYGPQVEYGVYGLPSTYMISPEGKIVDVHRGMYPNRATLRDRVVKLIEGEGA